MAVWGAITAANGGYKSLRCCGRRLYGTMITTVLI